MAASEQPWYSLSFVQGCSDGIQHISERSKFKSNCCKNGNYNKLFGCQGGVDYCGIARFILQLSSSKNEGGYVSLCQNSFAFMLPTTVAPVKCTLVTMVALGSFFSCFNTSLSLNDNIFIRCCCRALLCTCKPGKSDMFSAKVKTKV